MIPIRNVYYMLSYAFRVLREGGYQGLGREKFSDMENLLAAVLIQGMSLQIKRGIGREYINIKEPLSLLKGKIQIEDSLRARLIPGTQLVCSYDEFSINSLMNRILKTSLKLVLKIPKVDKERHRSIHQLLMYFQGVDDIDLKTVNWQMSFHRHNEIYRLLMYVCRLIHEGFLPKRDNEQQRVKEIFDDQKLHRLYEKFLLEYYRKEFPMIGVSSPQIPWMLDSGSSRYLPIMQSDVVLTYKQKILVIDAKFYSKTMSDYYGKRSFHSSNLYQVFTYIKNLSIKEEPLGKSVSGLLLYAKPDGEETLQPHSFEMSGNRIDVRQVNLDQDFSMIRDQLDKVVDDFLFKTS